MKRYIIVMWPESQGLFEFDWFKKECYLINDDEGLEQYGSSAYFIPEERYKELENADWETEIDNI